MREAHLVLIVAASTLGVWEQGGTLCFLNLTPLQSTYRVGLLIGQSLAELQTFRGYAVGYDFAPEAAAAISALSSLRHLVLLNLDALAAQAAFVHLRPHGLTHLDISCRGVRKTPAVPQVCVAWATCGCMASVAQNVLSDVV